MRTDGGSLDSRRGTSGSDGFGENKRNRIPRTIIIAIARGIRITRDIRGETGITRLLYSLGFFETISHAQTQTLQSECRRL